MKWSPSLTFLSVTTSLFFLVVSGCHTKNAEPGCELTKNSSFLIHQLIIAHRGASAEAPENTFSAFERSVEVGADIIELDVRMTKDNYLVIVHDERLDRTTNGIGKISDTTFSYIQQLDAGSWFSNEFAKEKLPLLQDVLIWHRKEKITLLLDAKETTSNFAYAIVNEIQTFGDHRNIIIGIRSLEQSKIYDALLPGVPQIIFISDSQQLSVLDHLPDDIIIHADLDLVESNIAIKKHFNNKQVDRSINTFSGNISDVRAILALDPDYIMSDDLCTLFTSLNELTTRRK